MLMLDNKLSIQITSFGASYYKALLFFGIRNNYIIIFTVYASEHSPQIDLVTRRWIGGLGRWRGVTGKPEGLPHTYLIT